MIVTGKHLSRRTVLRGAGAAIALPLLDSMVPALSPKVARAATAPVKLPLMCPNNSLSINSRGRAAQVILMIRAPERLLIAWMRSVSHACWNQCPGTPDASAALDAPSATSAAVCSYNAFLVVSTFGVTWLGNSF